MTDSTNTVVWEGEYKPFGEADVNPNSSVVNNFRFPGQYYDAETGLHYNYHRYYDPKTGRYVTPDPIGLEGGNNLYSYAGWNPINSIDLNGLRSNKPYWIIPRYGMWGGPGWSGGNIFPYLGPVDSMDECFMRHDECYGWGQDSCYQPDINKCDIELVECLKSLSKDHSKWAKPPKYPLSAELYREWAMAVFIIKGK